MDWLKKLAPTAATLLGGPMAGLAVQALGAALGVEEPTQKKIEDILTSGQLTAEQAAAIKQADNDLTVKLKELDVKVEELHAADRNSARQMHATIKSRIPAALTIVTVLGFFSMLIGAASGYLVLTGSDVMMLLLGVLARETAGVYQFWFGSSSGSQRKTDLMAEK